MIVQFMMSKNTAKDRCKWRSHYMDPFIHVKSLPDFVSPSTPLGRQNVKFLQFLWDKEELSRVLAGFLSFVAKEEAYLHDHPQTSRTRLAWGRTRVLMIETALSTPVFS